ncbi:peptide chain release factor N(5)-glutamine methyltransferase [bacterium]|nr:peptide chain release factor N(5)-glutamine methyltransferase [bacterium]MBU1638822.1 peptide chain release factor N(5)-glutamine methyltransferase [bacterium]
MNKESWKLIDLLTTASDFLAEKEIEYPRRNAEALLGKALAMPRIELYLQHDRPLRQHEINRFREMVKRRINREPLQQILGEVEFLGCRLLTPRGLLVPRPETELLAAQVVKLSQERFGDEETIRILDLGCGTGCLGIALASALPTASVDAVDIDPLAIETTEKNAKLNGVDARLNPIQSDMLEENFIERLSPPYNVVVSNPPYVRVSEFDSLAPEIRHFENPEALIGGENGLKFYRRIARILPTLLIDNGFAALELGSGQAEAVSTLMVEHGMKASVEQDLNGVERMLIALRQSE